MEMIKKNIHMNKIKECQIMQITLDDDFNVQDVKPDIEKIIKTKGQINIANYKLLNKKMMVEGDMSFCVLYVSNEDGRIIHSIEGKIPFEDTVNMELAQSDDSLNIIANIEDLSTAMVNSRKISVKAVITLECIAENIYDVESCVDIKQDEAQNIQYIKEDVAVTQIAVNKKDICRVKEEIVLPSSKQNVMEILYNDVSLLGVDSRVNEQGINIKGSMLVFVMYTSENGDIEYVEKEILFNNMIEVDGCEPDMIDDVRISLSGYDIVVKADTDGEERILDFEGTLLLDIKLYKEEHVSIVKDLYGVDKKIEPVLEPGYYDNVLLKNNCKVRISDRISVDASSPALMQLCNSSVNVKIDNVEVVENGLNVEGVAQVTMLYITNEDNMPVSSFEGMIPFNQFIEVKGIDKNSIYNIRQGVDHCSAMMTDSRECEVKLVVSLDTMVLGRQTKDVIVDINVSDFSEEENIARATMVGYVVKENECLWDIAKRFYTTRECIREVNFIEGDDVNEGDRILIV